MISSSLITGRGFWKEKIHKEEILSGVLGTVSTKDLHIPSRVDASCSPPDTVGTFLR